MCNSRETCDFNSARYNCQYPANVITVDHWRDYEALAKGRQLLVTLQQCYHRTSWLSICRDCHATLAMTWRGGI